MNQLMWYYAELEMHKCYSLPGGLPDVDNEDQACFIWRRWAKCVTFPIVSLWLPFNYSHSTLPSLPSLCSLAMPFSPISFLSRMLCTYQLQCHFFSVLLSLFLIAYVSLLPYFFLISL